MLEVLNSRKDAIIMCDALRFKLVHWTLSVYQKPFFEIAFARIQTILSAYMYSWGTIGKIFWSEPIPICKKVSPEWRSDD